MKDTFGFLPCCRSRLQLPSLLLNHYAVTNKSWLISSSLLLQNCDVPPLHEHNCLGYYKIFCTMILLVSVACNFVLWQILEIKVCITISCLCVASLMFWYLTGVSFSHCCQRWHEQYEIYVHCLHNKLWYSLMHNKWITRQYLSQVFLLMYRKSGGRTSILRVCAMGGLFLKISNCRGQEKKGILMLLALPASYFVSHVNCTNWSKRALVAATENCSFVYDYYWWCWSCKFSSYTEGSSLLFFSAFDFLT